MWTLHALITAEHKVLALTPCCSGLHTIFAQFDAARSVAWLWSILCRGYAAAQAKAIQPYLHPGTTAGRLLVNISCVEALEAFAFESGCPHCRLKRMGP